MKSHLPVEKFCNLIKIHHSAYYDALSNKRGINFKKFTEIHDFVKNNLTSQELKNFKIRAEQILTSKDTTIKIGKARQLNFNLGNLEKIEIGKQEYVILPTSTYEVKKKRNEIKNWALGFYVFTGRSPNRREFESHFRGYTRIEKEAGRKFSDNLKVWNLPIYESEKALIEGDKFDKIGKKCLEMIDENIKIDHYVHYRLESVKGNFVIPDGIKNDFNKNPIKIEGKNIYLKKGEKLDRILEFKRSKRGIQKKDKEIYSKIANNIDFYLLKSRPIVTEENWNGCKVTYHTKEELINLLKDLRKRKSERENEINSLISEIYNIGKSNNGEKKKI
ncbi:MAG: hypothetical protein HWN67_03530 [Candidatus Helarchaeota archaeon]|nr:hypothetical protein [Candidatus Helarchaeota archaeon]